MTKVQKELHATLREKAANEQILRKTMEDSSGKEMPTVSPSKIHQMEEINNKYDIQISP